MLFIKKMFGSKPIIAESKYKTVKDVLTSGFTSKSVGAGYSMKADVYYISASVELGNTTTKSIITATDLDTSHSYILNKTINMTRDIRPPKESEEVFGETVWGIKLTKESVAEMVKNTIEESLSNAKLDVDKDLDFVVRSTGVTAGFKTTEEVGKLIIALANGCLEAGIDPRKMTPSMSKSSLPERIREYTLLDLVMFDGAVVSVLPPKGKEVVANEMEGELITAGIKLAAKWTEVDYRNPCVSIDFGSTLAGRIVNNEKPYAHTIGNFLGLAGVIADSLIKGTGEVNKSGGAAIDLDSKNILKKAKWKIAKTNADRVHELIDIRKVPIDVDRFGTVPLDPIAAESAGTTLIGCDVGFNGDKLPELMDLGKELYQESGLPTLFATMDHVTALIVKRLLDVAFKEDIMIEGSVLGITGRAGITGKKPQLILDLVNDAFKDKIKDTIFVSDGLALGTSIMARCMNSMGTPKAPIGGNQGEKCILTERVNLQKKA
ncbi:MAG: methanogenesis marker 14 protein [Methanobrevibacter sp.]|jgi:putative methanogenesis marker protein 14|nr:methanogenesis marker 14 protein [Methanobrevibacter sp.]